MKTGVLRGRWELRHGRPAAEWHARAIASFERALDLDPSLSFAWANLRSTAIARANDQERRGLGSADGLAEVLG